MVWKWTVIFLVKTFLFWLLLFLLLLLPNLFQYLFQNLCHNHINFCYNFLKSGIYERRYFRGRPFFGRHQSGLSARRTVGRIFRPRIPSWSVVWNGVIRIFENFLNSTFSLNNWFTWEIRIQGCISHCCIFGGDCRSVPWSKNMNWNEFNECGRSWMKVNGLSELNCSVWGTQRRFEIERFWKWTI